VFHERRISLRIISNGRRQERALATDQRIKWTVANPQLKSKLNAWQHRFTLLADQSVGLSEVNSRRTRRDIPLETSAMFFLGLDGFSDEQSKAIKAACIKVIPLKKIVARITP
jgi:hypothetical protein